METAYYLITIQKFKDGSASAKSLFEYATKDEALVAYYNTLAASLSNVNLASVLCSILNDYGNCEIKEYWERSAS